MTPCASKLQLGLDGAELRSGAIAPPTLEALRDILAGHAADVAGVRLFGVEPLRPFLAPDGAIGATAASVMHGRPQPVRAILFDKTPDANWSLGWHQDRVIAVRSRAPVEGFGPWTRKHGTLHVAPPFEILAGMITLRVHLDAVPETNAPLLIAPGSHRLGRLCESRVAGIVEQCGAAFCLAEPGDIWIYSTPILHASNRAAKPMHRRVLQVDYASGGLPGGLEWLGV